MKMRLRAGEVDVRRVEDVGEVDPGVLAWLGTDIVRWDRCGLVVQTVDRQVLVQEGWYLARFKGGELVVLGPGPARLMLEPSEGA